MEDLPEKPLEDLPEKLMEDPASRFRAFFDELFGSYINIALLVFCAFLLFKILRKSFFDSAEEPPRPAPPPPMRKRDLTLDELNQFDGKAGGEDVENRILIAVNHNIFDVSRGRHLYGPGGPYGLYAGQDASRGLATFSVKADVISDTYDDLSDLSPSEMESLKEWESQLREKYDVVGRLLAPGEKPHLYDDNADDDDDDDDEDRKKDT